MPSTTGLTSTTSASDSAAIASAYSEPSSSQIGRCVGIGHAIHAGDHLAHLGGVAGVLGHVLAADRLDGQEADGLAQIGPPLEQRLEREEAAQHVLRRLQPVDADDQLAASRRARAARASSCWRLATSGLRANAASESGSMEIG